MLSPEVSIFPLLLAFFPLCSRCQCITNFDVIAFYTHISDCNAKCKAARIRPTILWESHDSQELMKFEFHHVSSIHFAQGIPFKRCWCETGRSCSQRQHLPLSAGEPEMKSQESREKHRQMINLLLNCKILSFFFFFPILACTWLSELSGSDHCSNQQVCVRLPAVISSPIMYHWALTLLASDRFGKRLHAEQCSCAQGRAWQRGRKDQTTTRAARGESLMTSYCDIYDQIDYKDWKNLWYISRVLL